MTDEELSAIEARAAKATAGPWEFERSEYCIEAGTVGGIGSPGEFDDIVQTDSGMYPPKLADAEFICAAREDVPKLVAEVRRLREALKGIEYGACDRECGHNFCPECWADNYVLIGQTKPDFQHFEGCSVGLALGRELVPKNDGGEDET